MVNKKRPIAISIGRFITLEVSIKLRCKLHFNLQHKLVSYFVTGLSSLTTKLSQGTFGKILSAVAPVSHAAMP